METQANHLLISTLNPAIKAVAAQLAYLQAPANAIVAQPDLIINSLPALPKQQSTARSIANSYLKQVGEILGNVRDTVVMLDNEYNRLYSKLVELAEAYENKGAGGKKAKELMEGVLLLKRTIEADEPKRQLINGNLKSLSNASASFTQGFITLLKEAEKGLGPDVIDPLQSQVNDVFDKIQEDNKTLSKGVVEDIKPIFDMIVAAISSASSKGEQQQEQVQRNSEIMSASIKKIKDVDAKQKAAMEDVDAQIKRYKALLLQLERDKLEYVLVCSLSTQIKMLNTQLPVLLSYWERFQASWKEVSNDLDELHKQLANAEPEKALLSLLRQAKEDWNNLSILVKGFYSIGKLPVETIKV
jgi:CRISPR/Cas system CSM-associated protein Csm2 small subunit